jgi:Raf kinase inhibitor-like YbhB/YbcL family protein
MHGSWNRRQPSGYEVVRVTFTNGHPSQAEPFLSGFVTTGPSGPTMFGRPTGVAVTADGALLVGDELNGVIYRVDYTGTATSTRAEPSSPAPAAAPTAGTMGVTASSTPLAMARTETSGPGTLSVTSSAFSASGAVPFPYSQYGERFSPALAWTSTAVGTQSFALVMEDPDAKAPKPYVHWLLYNVPGSVTSLHESIPALPRLKDLGGALQGRNSRGSIGYTGPRPPENDPPHPYHFQVFALDTTLTLEPGADREALLNAMRGHVLARGEVIGTFQKPR